MKRLVVTEEAKLDLAEIHAYLLSHSEQAAEELVEHIEVTFDWLAEHPLVGRRCPEYSRRGSQMRCWRVSTYLVCYRVRRDSVEIARVISGYRDLPRYLKK